VLTTIAQIFSENVKHHPHWALAVGMIGVGMIVVPFISNHVGNAPTPPSEGDTINAPYGIAAGRGSTVTNPVIHNDHRSYGVPKPLPKIVGVHIQSSVARTNCVDVIFSTDSPFANPMFLVRCDQPFRAKKILFIEPGTAAGTFAGTNYFKTNRSDKREMIVGSGSRTFLDVDVRVWIVLQSLTTSAVTQVEVEAYST